MRAFVIALMIALAGCAPAANEPAADAANATPATPATAAPAAAVDPAPAVAAPVPPAAEAAQGTPKELPASGSIDYACTTAADCAVKDVGSCCGRQPQCVNKDSPTFPEQVKAQCARDGMSSICGFQDIAGCECIEGRCTGVAGAGGSGELQQD